MIPTIDIAPLFGGSGPTRAVADAAVLNAAHEIGFMAISGLPGDVLSADRRRAMLAIFALPESKKREMSRRSFVPGNPNVYRGWFPLQEGHPTYKEGIDLGPDLVRVVAHDAEDPLTEPTPLPTEEDLPGWRRTAAEYYRAMESVGAVLMRSLARGLGLAETRFDAAFADGISSLRLIRYPPRDPRTLDPAFRVGDGCMLGAPHVDSGFVTLLAQDGVAGLEVEDRTGRWIGVPPQEGTLVVNFGKLLERWTGGRVKATRHRVIGSGAERFSVPFFYEPAVDTVIAPLGLGDDFAPVTYGDHLWEATTKFIEQKGIAHLRRPRGIRFDQAGPAAEGSDLYSTASRRFSQRPTAR
ncbi:MAG TPA: 2OG-Fe(II) oxygenase family protein [Candidatus Cybelea sp.]|nr:2OG-Fe(II) oxygenase family protein [Candidatus Cybelea sp.]